MGADGIHALCDTSSRFLNTDVTGVFIAVAILSVALSLACVRFVDRRHHGALRPTGRSLRLVSARDRAQDR